MINNNFDVNVKEKYHRWGSGMDNKLCITNGTVTKIGNF